MVFCQTFISFLVSEAVLQLPTVMNRNPAIWNGSYEEGNLVFIHHNGNNRWVRRSDFNQRPTVQDHKQANDEDGGHRFHFRPSTDRKRKTYELQQTPHGGSYGKYYPSTSYTNQANLEENEIKPHTPKDSGTESGTLENQESDVEYIFTLDDISESMQTVIERPITKMQSSETNKECQTKSNFKKESPNPSTILGKPPSTESLKTRKCSEVTEKLSHLKTHVVNLIDQTISQFESEVDLSQKETFVNKTAPQQGIHPGGDGSELDRRTQNVQVLKMESFVREKKNIRLKLYEEIETMMKRLKDMEFLE